MYSDFCITKVTYKMNDRNYNHRGNSLINHNISDSYFSYNSKYNIGIHVQYSYNTKTL